MKPMCAVRDSALDAFNNPFTVPACGIAVRSFSDEVNNAESPMNSHPEDFELFHIANFNDDTGVIESLESPRSLVRGKDVIKPRM